MSVNKNMKRELLQIITILFEHVNFKNVRWVFIVVMLK